MLRALQSVKEIKNGRLAMVAMLGYFVQVSAWNGKGAMKILWRFKRLGTVH